MSKNIAKATGLILVINMIVKLSGLLRETAIANSFGATGVTDAYLVAYTLPYFLQSVLGSALVTVVVPILTKYWLEGSEEEASLVGSSLINVVGILLAGLTVLGILVAPGLVHLTAPDLPAENFTLAVQLTRIMFPAVIFMGVGMVITGITNSRFNFALGAAASGVSNIIIIIGACFFTSAGIVGLAWATLISFVGFLLIQIPALKKVGFRYQLVLRWNHPAVKQVLKEIMPIFLGVAVNQIYFAINRIFASGLAEGSITILNYASKLMNLPIGIFVAAVASAIYPALSENAIEKNQKSLAETMKKGMSLIFLVAVPAAVGLIVLRVPIVQLLFERGSFLPDDTQATAFALLFFCIGLVPVAVNMVLTRAYYAMNDVKRPVILGLLSIVVNVIFSFILIEPLAHGGLALANSLAALFNTCLLYIGLLKKVPDLRKTGVLHSLGKMIIAALIMGVAVYFGNRLLGHIGGAGTLWLALRVFLAIGLGCLVYVLAALVLKVNELYDLWEMIRKKVVKRLTKTARE